MSTTPSTPDILHRIHEETRLWSRFHYQAFGGTPTNDLPTIIVLGRTELSELEAIAGLGKRLTFDNDRINLFESAGEPFVISLQLVKTPIESIIRVY